ncbi:hypothetical protein V6N11_075104 [Hibiscus sabdariffa]|uniref:Uncharacterized protein n=1 Tax=Hibiscus sabdariffa TaxID=183260 RepID=A0ABR2R5I9_9ROSI
MMCLDQSLTMGIDSSMEVIGAPMNLSTGSVFGSIRILKLYIGESIHEEELSATKIICGELVEVDESKEVQLPFKACIPFGSMEVMTEGIINTKASKILARRVVERTLNFSLCFKEQSGRDVKWREVNQQAVWIIRMSIGNHKISSLSHEQEVIGKDSMGQLNEDPFCWQTFGELTTPTVPPIGCLQIGKPANNRVQSDHDAYRAFSLR